MLSITTDKKTVPWSWIFLLSIPVAVFAYIEKCSGTALTFTLQKYTSDPALIAFVGSINKIFGVVIAPYAAYKSDFLSSRFGRRKGLIIIGFAAVAVSMVMLPNCNSLLATVVIVILLQASVDFGYTGPWKPLFFDIVPKKQRGKSMVVNRYSSIALRFVFMFFLLGNFDMKMGGGLPKKVLGKNIVSSITGEHLIYYLGALGVVISLFVVMFFVKDKKSQPQDKVRVKISEYVKYFFTNKQAGMICLLMICYTLMSTRLMTLRPLLITEQFGYSKQVLGNIHAFTMLTNTLVILPIIMCVIDKIDKFKLFMICLCLSTLHPIVYWSYVKFFAPMQIPSQSAIIFFNIADSVFDRTAFLVLWPIVFDYTDPARKGFINSGVLVVAGLISFVNINLMGGVVKMYSHFFTADGTYDYMSTYLYIFVAGIIALFGTFFFAAKRKNIYSDIEF